MGPGSGVASKRRLAEYSLSLPFAIRTTDPMGDTTILAGASGYAYKEWCGSFYPDKLKADAMLRWYGERLPTVEINNTFYRLPKANVLEHWAAETPARFAFAIKASRRITHLGRDRKSVG